MNIAIIGDYKQDYRPHPATTASLEHVAIKLGINIKTVWIPTKNIGVDYASLLNSYQAVWLGPSPYINREAVHRIVKYIRENNFPFLGTCGGLMHSIIEFGRNVLGLDESLLKINPTEPSENIFVIEKSCGNHEFKTIQFKTVDHTKTHKIYNREICEEDSNCSFSINPKYYKTFEQNNLIIGGIDGQNEAKILELASNKYYLLTKYLPQMRSTKDSPHPLIEAFAMSGLKNKIKS